MVKQFKVHNTTMIFKINIVKLVDKYSGLKKSSATLTFLTTILKILKKYVTKI